MSTSHKIEKNQKIPHLLYSNTIIFKLILIVLRTMTLGSILMERQKNQRWVFKTNKLFN